MCIQVNTRQERCPGTWKRGTFTGDGRVRCPVCGRCFKFGQTLRPHVARRTPPRPRPAEPTSD